MITLAYKHLSCKVQGVDPLMVHQSKVWLTMTNTLSYYSMKFFITLVKCLKEQGLEHTLVHHLMLHLYKVGLTVTNTLAYNNK